MGKAYGETGVEQLDHESIYSELAIRIDTTESPSGVSLHVSWDETGLLVTLLDPRGESRSERLVVAT